MMDQEARRKHRRMQADAHAAVARAVREGILARPTACAVCNASGRALGLHHHSYEAEHQLDVVGLCGPCHSDVHLGVIPEPLTGELRRGDRLKVVAPRLGDRRLYSGARWTNTDNTGAE